MAPPFQPLFAWLEGHQPAPQIDLRRAFRPLMLSNPLDEPELAKLDPADFRAAWKWDGIRVQLAACRGEARLFSLSGAALSGAFPERTAGADTGRAYVWAKVFPNWYNTWVAVTLKK